jgi:hypothetical protein
MVVGIDLDNYASSSNSYVQTEDGDIVSLQGRGMFVEIFVERLALFLMYENVPCLNTYSSIKSARGSSVILVVDLRLTMCRFLFVYGCHLAVEETSSVFFKESFEALTVLAIDYAECFNP